MRAARRSTGTCEDGFGLVEMIMVFVVLALLAAAVGLMPGTKESSREKVSISKMQKAKTALQLARDRERMSLVQVLGSAGSVGPCAGVDPMPTVAKLSGDCRIAWDAVNAKLAPYVGSVPAAAQMMTDAAGRPILVEAVEGGCGASAPDHLTTVHPTGDRSRPAQKLALAISRYGC